MEEREEGRKGESNTWSQRWQNTKGFWFCNSEPNGKMVLEKKKKKRKVKGPQSQNLKVLFMQQN